MLTISTRSAYILSAFSETVKPGAVSGVVWSGRGCNQRSRNRQGGASRGDVIAKELGMRNNGGKVKIVKTS